MLETVNGCDGSAFAQLSRIAASSLCDNPPQGFDGPDVSCCDASVIAPYAMRRWFQGQ
jgi:hypothetical protein